jgi:hypothetical protein
MSGPAVVIGFILLIPSVVGMALSVLMLLGIFAYHGNDSEGGVSQMSAYNAGYRRECFAQLDRDYRSRSGYSPGPPAIDLMEESCECMLAVTKQTGSSEEMATTVCAQRLERNRGRLPEVSQDLKNFYAGTVTHSNRSLASGFRIFGGGLTVAFGIACFVSGLLGWLLVMKKRVLQCSMCGAVVNAS